MHVVKCFDSWRWILEARIERERYSTCLRMLSWIGLNWIGLQEEKRSYKDCAGEKGASVPSACVGLRETYFQCKRGQVRFRGLRFFFC
jgi:hypothetical protein